MVSGHPHVHRRTSQADATPVAEFVRRDTPAPLPFAQRSLRGEVIQEFREAGRDGGVV